MESEKVQISTKILALLVLMLLGAFVIIAFLMGRESARKESPVAVQTGVSSAQAMPSAPPAMTESSARMPSLPPAQPPVQPQPEVLPSYSITQAPAAQQTYAYSPPASPKSARPASGGGGVSVQQGSGQMADKEQVTQYFTRFDQIGAMSKSFDDPNAYAQEMLKQVTSGDTSGIDRLISNYQNFHDQIGQLSPPAVCKEHQRITMAVVQQSIGNLNDLKSAIARGDMGALTRITGDMKSVEEKSRQADKIAAQIKTQYGLK
jgi:hypothetical protein